MTLFNDNSHIEIHDSNEDDKLITHGKGGNCPEYLCPECFKLEASEDNEDHD